LNCKDYKYDDYKDQFTNDTRPNCTYEQSDGAAKDVKEPLGKDKDGKD
jgi:hypothetical protein